MLSSEEYKRYSRQIALPGLGFSGQQALKDAKVLVVGAGGLGCPALQHLAASGVGTIGIVDHDQVELSNLPRQLLYTEDAVGLFKAEQAAAVLRKMNKHAIIHTFIEKLEEMNAQKLIEAYDIIIDATDNTETRYVIDAACLALKKSWIFGGVYRYEGQLSVFNFPPLGESSYASLYPPGGHAPPADCNTAGVLGVLPGVIGTLQAAECIKMITGIGEVLAGKVLVIDLLNMKQEQFSIPLPIKSN